jgi:hypothetical protein
MSDPIPCPECRKPIQPQASNCWFCGAVFDTTPCPHCDSAVKRGAPACWFCGEPLTVAPDREANVPAADAPLSENIQSQPLLHERRLPEPASHCSACGEKLAPPFRYCPGCGKSMQTAVRRVHWEEQPLREAHRAGTLLTIAIIGLFGCGVILGLIVVVRAMLDLSAMRERRMDPSGEGMTIAALVIGILAAVTNVVAIYLGLRWV